MKGTLQKSFGSNGHRAGSLGTPRPAQKFVDTARRRPMSVPPETAALCSGFRPALPDRCPWDDWKPIRDVA